MAREARVAAACHVGAGAVPAAVVGADGDRAVLARVAHGAAAFAVEALAARGAVVRAARRRACWREEALVALADAIVIARAAPVAVIDAARTRRRQREERCERVDEEAAPWHLEQTKDPFPFPFLFYNFFS